MTLPRPALVQAQKSFTANCSTRPFKVCPGKVRPSEIDPVEGYGEIPGVRPLDVCSRKVGPFEIRTWPDLVAVEFHDLNATSRPAVLP